jgi:hypothetical protein
MSLKYTVLIFTTTVTLVWNYCFMRQLSTELKVKPEMASTSVGILLI